MSSEGTPGPVTAVNLETRSRQGRMTAIMRAMTQAAGTKVLRVALLRGGRIIDERLMRRRATVTVGSSAKVTFVVHAANFPAQFKLFERIGGDYVLNILDGMTGSVALPRGLADLAALKDGARRVGSAYQVKIPDDTRGKIVIGDATFLFQFVAALPANDRPQLPPSVKGGLVSQIDWNLTVLAAVSFLLHFGAVAVSARWDAEATDAVTVGLLEMAKDSIPPAQSAIEEKTDPSVVPVDMKPNVAAPNVPKATDAKAPVNPKASAANVDAKEVDALVKQADVMFGIKIGALGGGPATRDVLKDNGSPVPLDQIGNQGRGRDNGLDLGHGTGPVVPGAPIRLEDIQGNPTPPVSTTAGAPPRVLPPIVRSEGIITDYPPEIDPPQIQGLASAARGCYQRIVGADPAAAGQGRLSLTIKVGPSGEVTSVAPGSNTGVGAKVVSCITSAAGRFQFKAPGPRGATITTAFNFVQQASK